MSGTKAGGVKTAATNKSNNPDFYKNIALLAQAAWIKNGRKPRGFSTMTPEQRATAGSKGGSLSVRPSKK